MAFKEKKKWMGLSYGNKYFTYSTSAEGALRNLRIQALKAIGKYDFTELRIELEKGSNVFVKTDFPRYAYGRGNSKQI